jgi:hypothetical protein
MAPDLFITTSAVNLHNWWLKQLERVSRRCPKYGLQGGIIVSPLYVALPKLF